MGPIFFGTFHHEDMLTSQGRLMSTENAYIPPLWSQRHFTPKE